MIEQDWLYTLSILEVTLTNKILMNHGPLFWNFNTFAGFADFCSGQSSSTLAHQGHTCTISLGKSGKVYL